MSLQYTMVIGDSFSSVFAAVGLPKVIASRNGAIALITGLCTLPLSLLPNLEMLKYTSFLGIGGLLYTAGFMVARVGAYKPASALHDAVPAAMRPKFTDGFTLASMLQPKVFVLLSIFLKGHALNTQGWAGIGVACLGILGELEEKYSKSKKKAA